MAQLAAAARTVSRQKDEWSRARATQQVEDALLQEYDQIAGGASKYALLAQKYGLDSESSFMHKMRRARARRQSAEATSTVSVHEAMARLAVIQL